VYLSEGSWYALSATPELRTLRQIRGLEQRLQAWTAMLERAVVAAVDHGVCLDLNPSNFGRSELDGRLYYIDDEWYPQVRPALLASGIVSRIPEEPTATEHVWQSWGQVIAGVLCPLCDSLERREELVHCIAAHPLVAQFASRRAALCEGLRGVMLRSPARGTRRLTAIPGSVGIQD
jgi:hypothetical protein